VRRLSSIQILRAGAAFSVALFHAAQWSHIDLAVGAAGVDLFFVISGFVLWAACEARPTTPAAFLLARAERILPLYWVATLVVAAGAVWRPAALPIVHPGSGHLALSLLLIPHDDPAGGPFPLLPTGWTLTYEAFFYAVMALALLAPRDKRWTLLSAILFAAALIGFGYHGWYTLLANPLLLEFLAGAALARAWSKGRFERLPAPAGWALIASGLLILLACQLGGLRDDFLRPFVWGPPAVMIVAGALKLEANGRIAPTPIAPTPIALGPITRALVAQGDASYSLYLVQAPLIAAFAWLTPAWPTFIRLPVSLALAVAGGWLCWTLLERPIGLALRRLHQLPAAHRRGGRGLGLAEQEPLAALDADVA
jgi:exopolysaccharide production protein ExoZ